MRVIGFGLLVASVLAGCAVTSASEEGVGTEGQALVVANCTYTQGYWKNHPDAWPVSSLKLGTVNYTKAQLLSIFDTPVKGNGLIALAHQLIAAKLNVAQGAVSTALGTSIADADALIGSRVVPPVGKGSLSIDATTSLTDKLDSFNSGQIGPGHCGDVPPPPPPPPPPPVCGNGILETGEQCDDGNLVDNDGCSPTCQVCSVNPPPPPAPVCGNGIVEGTEQCDDGNQIDNDACSNTCELCPTLR